MCLYKLFVKCRHYPVQAGRKATPRRSKQERSGGPTDWANDRMKGVAEEYFLKRRALRHSLFGWLFGMERFAPRGSELGADLGSKSVPFESLAIT